MLKPARDVLATYDLVASGWDRHRDLSLFEKPYLDRLLSLAPGLRILDLGCGSGRPMATYLHQQGAAVTGVDGAPAMTAIFHENLPDCEIVTADMRGLDLGRVFDAVLAWDSFFHLPATAQEDMFEVFARHLASDGVLMFTSGPQAGEAWGTVEGEPVYHASLDPEQYRAHLQALGLREISFTPEDPDCQGRSVWIARASRTIRSDPAVGLRPSGCRPCGLLSPDDNRRKGRAESRRGRLVGCRDNDQVSLSLEVSC